MTRSGPVPFRQHGDGATTGSALLVLDVQQALVTRIGVEPSTIMRIRSTLDSARQHGVLVIFVAFMLRAGGVDASGANKRIAAVASDGVMVEGNPGVELDPRLGRLPQEPVVIKRRVSAFADTDLAPILRAHQITDLYLCGLTTSGAVLSTMRHAVDADYRVTVLRDLCQDSDPEVHEILVDRVFPQHASVTSGHSFPVAITSPST